MCLNIDQFIFRVIIAVSIKRLSQQVNPTKIDKIPSTFFLRQSLFQIDSEESFTLGVGFLYKIINGVSLRFDYSYADFGRLNNTQKFSVGVVF